MSNSNEFNNFSGARVVASLFGVLAGIGGFVHGIGEVQQGSVNPGSIVFNSWAQGPIATNMGGEPAMSILPNIQLSGMLTLIASTAVLIWSLAFMNRKNGGRVLILLSLAMLLVGGGFGPPLIGILAGWAGTGINAPLKGWRARMSSGSRRTAVQLWPWFFGLAAISGSFLVVGSLILVYLFGLNNAGLFLNTFYLTALSLLATVLLTPFFDARQSEQGQLA